MPGDFNRFRRQIGIEWTRTWDDIRSFIFGKPIEYVIIGKTRVTCCAQCKIHSEKENPIYPSLPIITCMDTAKVAYNPAKIPRWCPYAK